MIRWSPKVTYLGSWDPGSISDGDETATDVSLADVQLGDYAYATLAVDVEDLQLTASVTASGTVSVVLSNSTGGAVNLGSSTLRIAVIGLDVAFDTRI